ncbi:ABC transporter ATP-binding protein [Lentibacillus halophilus]|uniref:ABC transporter ATP-binding protein n=1 Tax=Lentibacillus halophilus TaxID=295065 RepID=A0ABN0Z4S7_9BACI
MIEFENVTKAYNSSRTKAVNNVSFHVPEGNTVVLLGPSGCGKTTLLRMVNCLVPITEGTIRVNGKDITSMDPIELRRSIGYVIQSNGLFPNMTIKENIVIVPDLLGWSKKKKHDRYLEMMELIGLDAKHYQKRYPSELSGGQQQRIGIARALAADPPVMLMDEPFGALDPINRTHLQEELLSILRKVKKTILFVSHDIDEAIKMGDKVAIFKEGELMQYDHPSDILTHPNSEFIARFLGNDRALKSLSLYSVRDLIESFDLKPVDVNAEGSRQISLNNNLRDTISTLLNQEASQLVVIDEFNKPLGAITSDRIEAYLHEIIRGSASLQGVEQ